MVKTQAEGRAQAHSNAREIRESERGWYFYGITHRQPLAAVLADSPDTYDLGNHGASESDDTAPLQLLEFSGVVAVVRPVRLSDFAPTVVEARLQNAAELEAMVRSHHRVIEAIHAHQPMLPAKFGMVFPHARDILSTLRTAYDRVLRQLQQLADCDEWAVHLYAQPLVVRERASSTEGKVSDLRQELASARPGRLWFLERQIRDEVEAATQLSLVTHAQRTFDRLAACSVAGQVSAPARPANASDEVEILSASFLVRREGVEQFTDNVDAITDTSEGLRCECTGPWPPYSFADLSAEVIA